MLFYGMKEFTRRNWISRVFLQISYMSFLLEEWQNNLTIEIIAEAFHGADYFLLEQLKLQIIEILKINTENEWNLSAKVLSQLLECMELAALFCNSINSVLLKSVEYCNLNVKSLEYYLLKIKREETIMFVLSEYNLLHYIILWAVSSISEDALSFYKSCLPSSETVKSLNRINDSLIYIHNTQFKNPCKISITPLLNHVKLVRIHSFIISNILNP